LIGGSVNCSGQLVFRRLTRKEGLSALSLGVFLCLPVLMQVIFIERVVSISARVMDVAEALTWSHHFRYLSSAFGLGLYGWIGSSDWCYPDTAVCVEAQSYSEHWCAFLDRLPDLGVIISVTASALRHRANCAIMCVLKPGAAYRRNNTLSITMESAS